MPNRPSNNRPLLEGLARNDLTRLVKPRVHIDEFKSKMGEDADISVLSFSVIGKEPADDLMDFFEKGYTWILDADASPGEFVKNIYLVFVELERTAELPEQIKTLLSDLENLTEHDLDDWSVYYGNQDNLKPVNLDNLAESIPVTPREYRQYRRELDQLKSDAGLNIDTNPVRDQDLKELQSAAGIK